jgi:hypothetical protein
MIAITPIHDNNGSAHENLGSAIAIKLIATVE